MNNIYFNRNGGNGNQTQQNGNNGYNPNYRNYPQPQVPYRSYPNNQRKPNYPQQRQRYLYDENGNPYYIGPDGLPRYINTNPYQQKRVSYQPDPPEEPKKHRFTFLIVALCLILVVAIAFCGLNVFVYSTIDNSGYNKTKLKDNEYIDESELFSSEGVLNILLLGVDEESNGSSRSDSMILVSIDSDHKKIKLTSFLRDCLVYIPSKDFDAKLNAACTYGGAQLVIDTIEYNFGVDIDHYVKVDFEMFKELIDEMDGIEVEVTEDEADFINTTTKQTVESGESVHLNGEEALVYSRIRKLDNDYKRTQRQRKVISAIIKKAKGLKINELYDLAKDILPLLETDYETSEIMKLLYSGGYAALSYDIMDIRMPSNDLMKEGNYNSQFVEIPDIEGCKELLYEFIYTDYEEDE